MSVFKQDVINLVVKHDRSFMTAAESINASARSLRERRGKPTPDPEPCGDDASVPDLQAEFERLRQ